MNIGEYELTDNDLTCANQIISEFYGHTCEITEGTLCQVGRSTYKKNQYVMGTKKQRFSIKLPYGEDCTHAVEYIVHEARSVCGLENYNIKQIKGFPMNGDRWRKENSLLIDWGIKDIRTDLSKLDPKSLDLDDKKIFLSQMAINASFVYYLDIWDRASRNFVWDKKEKKIFSIDHERLSHNYIDSLVISRLSIILETFCEKKWYDNKELKNCFEQEFTKTWNLMVEKNSDIENIFKKYDQAFTLNDKKRIKGGPSIPCALIMTRSADN